MEQFGDGRSDVSISSMSEKSLVALQGKSIGVYIHVHTFIYIRLKY